MVENSPKVTEDDFKKFEDAIRAARPQTEDLYKVAEEKERLERQAERNSLLMSKAPEAPDERENRLELRRWVTIFCFILLGFITFSLLAMMAADYYFQQKATSEWGRTIIAGIVGGAVSYLFGSRTSD